VVRPKHPKPELEAILKQAEIQGWRVDRGKKYYKMFCPCKVHFKTVHLSPSDPNYPLNLRKWLTRTGCWKELPG